MKEKSILKDALNFMLLPRVCKTVKSEVLHTEWFKWFLKVVRYEVIDIGRIEKLIARGANIHARDEAKNTMLHIAVERDYCLLAEVLKRNGADMDVPNMWGVTPRQLEAERNNFSQDMSFTSCQPHYYSHKCLK